MSTADERREELAEVIHRSIYKRLGIADLTLDQVEDLYVRVDAVLSSSWLEGERARARNEAERGMHARELHHFETEQIIARIREVCAVPLRVKVDGSSEGDAAMAAMASVILRLIDGTEPATHHTIGDRDA